MKKEKGITLIALVITIIVLLILAGVSISLTISEVGILSHAKSAKEENRGATVEELKDLWKTGKEELSNEENIESLLESLGPNDKKLLTNDEIDTINKFGQVTIGSRTIVFKDADISEFIKIGDYINYDPTYLDFNKTISVPTEKLTYTSPTGNASNHGNGYTSSETGGGQKFTAKPNSESGISWRVLKVKDNEIEIVPNKSIKTDLGKNFCLKGAVGYLYSDQELNEICKIYGYGYGADTSKSISYTIGDSAINEEIKGSIQNTGSRCINEEDFFEISEIYTIDENGTIRLKYKDGTNVNSSYGNTDQPSSKTYCPTTTTASGVSNTPELKNMMCTYYMINKSSYTQNIVLQSVLFSGYHYWISSHYTSMADVRTSCLGLRYSARR